jgi:hypothetical protein
MGLKYVYTTTLLGLRGHSLTVPVIETPDCRLRFEDRPKQLAAPEKMEGSAQSVIRNTLTSVSDCAFFVSVRCLHFNGLYAHPTHECPFSECEHRIIHSSSLFFIFPLSP